VVANGGLSLIGEAVYLGKPVYSVPVKHQYEQMMNARYIEALGYGLCAGSIDGDVLRMFLREHPRYAARVARHTQDGNEVLFATVDKLVKQLGRASTKRKKRATREAEA
jgi:UDP-N-acetylglucosamine:LPS N-acetylglucosamine transferase